MEEQLPQKKPSHLMWILMLFLALELSALISLFLRNDQQQLKQITEQMTLTLNVSANEYQLKRFNSRRIGPYQWTAFEFIGPEKKSITAHTRQWWGLRPSVTCLDIEPNGRCQ